MARLKRSPWAALALIVSLLLAPWPPAVPTRASSAVGQQARPAPAATFAVFLPTVARGFGAPEVRITSQEEGSFVSGTAVVAAQPVEPGGVASVSFRAGGVDLGTDTTPADGFKVFVNVRDLPPGPLTLTATASGPGGTATTKVGVTAIPSPPQSATVGQGGATLGSEIGSVITLPPGAVPAGTNVSITERSQQQVTADTGINWDRLGVTFLGAQQIQSASTITVPLGVSSAGFGQRVQPGQAVVNYRLAPDADGDGVAEIVVANTASVAPTNDVVADPTARLIVTSVQVTPPLGKVVLAQGGLNGPPGTLITVRGSGFSAPSSQGNLALFRSADGKQIEVPGFVAADGGGQSFTTLIPPLAPGGATLTLRNSSTGATAGPFAVSVSAAPPLSAPAAQIIDGFFADAITFVGGLSPDRADAVGFRDQTVARLTAMRQSLPQLQGDPSADTQKFLNDTATIIQNAGLGGALQQLAAEGNRPAGFLTPGQKAALIVLGASLLLVASIGLFPAGAIFAAANIPYALAIAGSLLAYIAAIDDAIDKCYPSQTAGSAGTTGMGAAPPAGGAGCGSIFGGGGGGRLSLSAASEPGRYVVKIFRRGTAEQLTPFSGGSDPGGYFFIPLIPQGEPFTAVAIDTATGTRKTLNGVGPAQGESQLLLFDFSPSLLPPEGISTALPFPNDPQPVKLTMALDGNDDPMLAYGLIDPDKNGDPSDSTVNFSRWDRGQRRWRTPVVVDTFIEVYDPAYTDQFSLAYDKSSGQIGLLYASALGGSKLLLATSADGGATWAKAEVGQGGSERPRYPALAMANGAVHIAYIDANFSTIPPWYAVRGPGASSFSYSQMPLLAGMTTIYDTKLALALDGAGQPAVAALQGDGTNTALAYWRPGSPTASEVARTATAQGFPPSVSMAFFGTKPRLAYHMYREAGGPLWASASDDGSTWAAPVLIQEGTIFYQALAVDGQGRAAVAANTYLQKGGSCGSPLLARSNDMLTWSVCSPDAAAIPGFAGTWVNLSVTGAGKLYMAFTFPGNATVVKGIVLWREP